MSKCHYTLYWEKVIKISYCLKHEMVLLQMYIGILLISLISVKLSVNEF